MLKRLTTLIVITWLSCVLTNSAFATLGAATVWEVRTTGATTGGGGFDSGVAVPGTDFSQQNAAEDSGTDLTCADGDAAAPVIASATHNFVAADEGNIINITEAGDGFTLGRYLIVDTSANTATLDSACGTDGAKTGGDWYLGGAVDHPNTISTIIVAGNTIYIKNGRYVKVGENAYVFTLSVSGGTSTPIKWIGYESSRTDAPLGDTRPDIDGDSDDNAIPDTTNCVAGAGTMNFFYNIRFRRSTTSNVAGGSVFISCKINNGTLDGSSVSGIYINCEINTNGDAANDTSAVNCHYQGCYIHDNTGEGGYQSGTSGYCNVIYSISESNGGHGFGNGGGQVYFFNSITYNNTGVTTDGFVFARSSTTVLLDQVLTNNMAVSNGRYGFNRVGSGNRIYTYFDYNLYNGNGTAGLYFITAGAHDSTADPLFTSAVGGDFTLQSGSPALAIGFLQTIPGATGDYQWNIGVDQDDNTAAGGGGGSTVGYGCSN
jgi:hypothetical protein